MVAREEGMEGGAGKGAPDLSVIIPVLNEAAHLPGLLAGLERQRHITVEIIIADGGSTDGSERLARRAGASWIDAPRGRGAQMNAAARQARGEFLFFLHADSTLGCDTLLADGLAALRREQAERRSEAVAGHFSLSFVREHAGQALFFRYLEAKSGLSRAGTINGDQGFLLKRSFFEELGGFSEQWPFLEDQELAGRIRLSGRWLSLPGHLHTSARRFESEGAARRYLLMGIMMGCYTVGLPGFFEGAPGLYRAQHRAEKLRLSPFFRLLWRLTVLRLGISGNLRFWIGIGRYVRRNAWQAFFFLDLLLGREKARPLLRFHDRCLARLLGFPPVDALVGVLAFACYMLLLPTWFGLSEALTGRKHS